MTCTCNVPFAGIDLYIHDSVVLWACPVHLGRGLVMGLWRTDAGLALLTLVMKLR